MKKLAILLLTSVLCPVVSLADTQSEEIDYLIESVGREGCSFIRNDRKISGAEARSHLRSKRDLNARIFSTPEEFIEKIASRSATSGKPYLVSCRAQKQQTAEEWFTFLLEKYRWNELNS